MELSRETRPAFNDPDHAGRRDPYTVLLLAAAFVGSFLKLAIAYNTFGTNDAVTFYSFARSLSDHGLEWTYRHGVVWLQSGPLFNHPPLTAYFLRGIYHLAQADVLHSNGFSFPFLLRLPGIIADFLVILLFLKIAATDERIRRHRWALFLFA